MDFVKWLSVGTVCFSAAISFFILTSPERALALTANSQEQFTELSRTIRTVDDNTLRGKLGNDDITFVKQRAPDNPGFTANFTIYEARNLDCDGEKARVSINNSLTNIATLSGKYKTESGECSNLVQIRMNINEQGEISGSTDAEGDLQGDACEVTSSGVLGWILCPIIELGVSFSGLVFEEFVEPFLQDVPVSTKPDDPSYDAWKSFRVIGNILLVGTLLAVVYAQVKGDR